MGPHAAVVPAGGHPVRGRGAAGGGRRLGPARRQGHLRIHGR